MEQFILDHPFITFLIIYIIVDGITDITKNVLISIRKKEGE